MDGDKIVQDSLTGLTWEVDFGSNLTWSEAEDYCKNLNYAGSTDWRLPDPHELSSLVNYSKQKPAIDTTVFPGTPSGYFWASTSKPALPTLRPVVDFANHGLSYIDGGTERHYARCVIGSQAPYESQGRFVTRAYKTGEPVVIDMLTGLMWQKTGADNMNWQQALAYCEGLDYGGFSDWRLPDVNEMTSMVAYEKSNPASDFPGISSVWFWTSTPDTGDPGEALETGFVYGFVMYNHKDSADHVLCVRGL